MLAVLLIAFGVMAVCVVIHTTALVTLGEWLMANRDLFERKKSMLRETALLIVIFGTITTLHLLETALWAGFYRWLGLFSDFETSLYYSLISYSTIGYGDVVLPNRWRILGGVEGISGVLLAGLSTAFLFVIVNGLLQIRQQRQAKKSED